MANSIRRCRATMVAVFWLVGLALAAQVPAAGSSSVAAPAAWLVHRFPARYRVSIAVAPARNTLDLSATSSYRQQVLIPVPVSDERQTVGPVTHSAGQLQVGSLDGQRVLYLESSRPIGPFSLEFEIQTSETVVDWSLVTTIRPYDRTSVDYRRYTGALAGWIEPDNARIRQISGSLRAQAADALDYARRAYAWLQANLEWRDVQGGGIDGIVILSSFDPDEYRVREAGYPLSAPADLAGRDADLVLAGRFVDERRTAAQLDDRDAQGTGHLQRFFRIRRKNPGPSAAFHHIPRG